MNVPLDALRACLEYAVAQVPHYRARAADYDPDRARSRATFGSLPLLTKEAVRAALPFGLLADCVSVRAGLQDGTLESVSTSGTGGERISIWADARHVGIPADDLELWGLEPSPRLQRLAILASPQCLGKPCDGTFESRLRGAGRSLILPSTDEPLAMERELASAISADLARMDAGELFVNPVYLHGLVRACRTFGLRLPEPELILLSYQYATRCQRRALAEAFPGARIYSFYGASELGGATVGIECKHSRMHVWHEQAYVEIVDDRGLLVADGGRGHIAVTTPGIRVMPLVRYLVGDLGCLRDEPCACPLGAFPTLEHHGRERDALLVRGRLFSTRDVDDAIGAPPGLDAWQVVQRDDELEVRCVPALDADLDAALVAEAVGALTGVRVHPRIVGAIDPEPSGKLAHTRRG